MKRTIIALAFLAVLLGAYSCIRHDIKEAYLSKEADSCATAESHDTEELDTLNASEYDGEQQ